MTLTGRNRQTVVMALLVVLLFILSVWYFVDGVLLKVRLAHAEEQTAIFEEMRSRAVQSDVAEAASCLEYAHWYYPSGTKHPKGSHLDRIVERHRTAVTLEILAYLRGQTGQNWGDDPVAWSEKYAKK